jgi:hypothetical protein
MFRFIPILLICFYSNVLIASETGETKIKSIGSTFKGVTVILENNNHNISNCSGPYADNQMFMIPTTTEYKTISSFLLAAYMAGKKVNIVSTSCTTDGYSAIRDVLIVNTP